MLRQMTHRQVSSQILEPHRQIRHIASQLESFEIFDASMQISEDMCPTCIALVKIAKHMQELSGQIIRCVFFRVG